MSNELAIKAGNQSNQDLSKLQKQFNNLLKKIEEAESMRLNNQEVLKYEKEKIRKELNPVEKKLFEAKFAVLEYLDFLLENSANEKPKMSAKRASLLREFIELQTESMLNSDGDILGLKELHNKYSRLMDYDEKLAIERKMVLEQTSEALKEQTGMDFDFDLDITGTAEEMEQRLFAKLAEIQKQLEEQIGIENEKERTKYRTAKQQAKYDKAKEEENMVTKSLRTIYTDLVKALHPDLEQDETEINRKTELMKEVTAAYERKDLPALLKLQLKVDLIDQSKLSSIGDLQLKRYIKQFKEQLDTLNVELEIMFGFFSSFNTDYYSKPVMISQIMVDAHVSRSVNQKKSFIEYTLMDLERLKKSATRNEVYKEMEEAVFEMKYGY